MVRHHEPPKFVKHARHVKTFAIKKRRHGKIVKAHKRSACRRERRKAPTIRAN